MSTRQAPRTAAFTRSQQQKHPETVSTTGVLCLTAAMQQVAASAMAQEGTAPDTTDTNQTNAMWPADSSMTISLLDVQRVYAAEQNN